MKQTVTRIGKLTMASLVMFSLTMTSCKKEEGCTDPNSLNYNPDAEVDDGSCEYANSYTVPSEYSFTNVAYPGQTVRILLLKDLVAKINSATTTTVTAAELNAIYTNTPDMYTSISSGKKLEDKVANQAVKDSIQAWFAQIETLSGASGTYVRPDGVDLKQMVEKTLMGAVFYYRAVNDYLNPIASKDNSTVTPGQGTSMEHSWDEAFGYFGAARDYNTYTDAEIVSPGKKDSNGDSNFDPQSEICYYYSQTAAKRDITAAGFSSGSQSNFTGTIFSEFLKGRAGISNKDYVPRDNAVINIKASWDKLIAATVIHYINEVKSDITNSGADLNKHWAEMKGYLSMIQHNNANALGTANIATIDSYFGNKPADATIANLNAAANLLKTAYGFSTEQADNW
jgi:hypothetical protein